MIWGYFEGWFYFLIWAVGLVMVAIPLSSDAALTVSEKIYGLVGFILMIVGLVLLFTHP